MFLLDTNIFLEALLEQEKSRQVVSFLQNNNINKLCSSYFPLCSIGVILHKKRKDAVFQIFLNKVVNQGLTVYELKPVEFIELIGAMDLYNLDFDDAYQYQICKKHNLSIVTFDKDFNKTDLERFSIDYV